jgi:lipoprotein Spr
VGKPVSRSELRPGDLVFFRTRGNRISHVGIYIGNGKFVHASSARGRVRVDTLTSGYYHQRYVGARRITEK